MTEPLPPCVQGHEMIAPNIIWKNGAQAYCKICKQEREMLKSDSKKNRRAREDERFHEKAVSEGYVAIHSSNGCWYRKGPKGVAAI